MRDLPDPGMDGGDPCTRDGGLRSDLGENLLLAIAKAGDGDAVCVVPFLKASLWIVQGHSLLPPGETLDQ